jgi:hypothetical protein
MNTYEAVREQYKPTHIKFLLIAESPPPAPHIQSSRQFYYTDRTRTDDRLFINTVLALYPDVSETTESDLQNSKERWLRRLQSDGWYMIEALPESQVHEVTKKQRQERIRENLPWLIKRVRNLAATDTKILLIKSNVFETAAQPLRDAGFAVLNTGLLDYPGHFNQRAYREKLARYARQAD